MVSSILSLALLGLVMWLLPGTSLACAGSSTQAKAITGNRLRKKTLMKKTLATPTLNIIPDPLFYDDKPCHPTWHQFGA